MFHTNLLEDIGLSPETLWPKVLPRPPPIMSLDDIPAATSMPPLISHNSEPHLPPYSAMPTSTNDPKFNEEHPGFSDAAALDNPRAPNAKKYQPYGELTDRDRTQLSHKVNPYEPYIPFTRFGHELADFGVDIREPREPFISEEIEDLKDALMPIYDQLTLNWLWWILEFIPAKQVSTSVYCCLKIKLTVAICVGLEEERQVLVSVLRVSARPSHIYCATI